MQTTAVNQNTKIPKNTGSRVPTPAPRCKPSRAARNDVRDLCFRSVLSALVSRGMQRAAVPRSQSVATPCLAGWFAVKRDWAMRGAKDLCCVVADEALAQARPCCTVGGGVSNPKLCCTSGQHDKPMSESQIEIAAYERAFCDWLKILVSQRMFRCRGSVLTVTRARSVDFVSTVATRVRV